VFFFREHRFAEFCKRIAVPRRGGIRANVQNLSNLREREFTPNVQHDHLTLIVGQRLKRTTKIEFGSMVTIGRIKPQLIAIDRNVSLAKLSVIQERIAHAREKIRLRVDGISQAVRFHEFEKNVMHGILRSTRFATNADCK
jgi:hypothetical protein